MALPSLAEMTEYIRRAAAARGMDPDKIVQAVRTEGLGRGIWQSNVYKGNIREPSYGPFQMLVGGPGTGHPTGLGNQFMAATGLNPANPANWQPMVDYALNTIAKEGWQQWHGPKNAGMGNWYGVGKDAKAQPVAAAGPSPTSSQYDPLSSIRPPVPDYLRAGPGAGPGSEGPLAEWYRSTKLPLFRDIPNLLAGGPGPGAGPGSEEYRAPAVTKTTDLSSVPAAGSPASKKKGIFAALASLGQSMAPDPVQAPSWGGGSQPRGGDVSIPQFEYPRARLPTWGGGMQEDPEDMKRRQLLAMLGRG